MAGHVVVGIVAKMGGRQGVLLLLQAIDVGCTPRQIGKEIRSLAERRSDHRELLARLQTTDDTDDTDDLPIYSYCARAVRSPIESHPWSSVVRGLGDGAAKTKSSAP